MIVKISIEMVEHYLSLMMSVWFNHHDVESENLEDYKNGAIVIGRHMEKWKDEEYMQLAFAHLIVSDDIPQKIWDNFEYSCNYSFVEHEFKEIVEYAYSVLWSDTLPEKALNNYEVEFISTGIDQTVWCSKRNELNPSF